ncbi:MAG: hypothetical protein IKZ57_07630 [Spirochaetia bacterium]|nr:hypothetical protein [Spirochaetia bacterium]
MKKLFLLAIILITAVSSAFAGPFGLEMGMNLDDITKACGGVRPERLENDDRYWISPTKNHPDFEYYLVWVDETKGLYCIRAISTEIKTSRYGTELKSFFHEMTERLSKTYGKPTIFDEIKKDVYDFYKKDEWWMTTLSEGSRVLESVWEKESRTAKMSKDLDYVDLYAKARKYSFDKGYLVLEYGFINSEDIKKSQDDVF